MVKSNSHMGRVRQKLLNERTGITKSKEVRMQRELKKAGEASPGHGGGLDDNDSNFDIAVWDVVSAVVSPIQGNDTRSDWPSPIIRYGSDRILTESSLPLLLSSNSLQLFVEQQTREVLRWFNDAIGGKRREKQNERERANDVNASGVWVREERWV
ncbi:hypothetical protein DL93DRAFT_2097984 [Clavulina sp. PMI_390]|nr:hypothetical protein DL93DRAFT_2097984 [Clavulina sp. PMI_390]